MLKSEELAPGAQGCLARADDNEMVFVLLARDATAPMVIDIWCDARIACGKNEPTDHQIIEARKCAEVMREQYKSRLLDKLARSLA